MGIVITLPMLLIPLIIYNVLVWGGAFSSSASPLWGGVEALSFEAFSIPMPSGAIWTATYGDLFLLLSLFLLLIEIIKSSGSGLSAIINHALSMLVFIICLLEFLLLPDFSNTLFFLLTMMAFLDVMGGFVITVVTARRDISVTDYGD